MSRRNDSFVDALLKAPWWVSVILGLAIYAGLRLAPAVFPADPLLNGLGVALAENAYLALWCFGLIAAFSGLFGAKRKRLVDRQTSLETLRETSWKDFEHLVGEAYRRRGFSVDYLLGAATDGGVDLTLRKNGRTALVQCKQWKKSSVGVPVIREMFGILNAERADEVIVVTTGRFTGEALKFAEGKPIELVDGPRLLELVRSVQPGGRRLESAGARDECVTPAPASQDAPQCPVCGSAMVARRAKQGKFAGRQFWGCPTFPKCRGTREW